MKLEPLFFIKQNNLYKIQTQEKLELSNFQSVSYQEFFKNPLANEFIKIDINWSSIEIEDEVYNEELLAQLRENLKKLDETNRFAIINPIVDKQISSFDDADLFINACNHMARRIKDCESLIGLEIPEQIFAIDAASDFIETLSKKHANYVYFTKKSNETKVNQLLDTEEYAIMAY